MLAEAGARLGPDVRLVEGTAERLPFDDASFDALSFTYLLRYVSDPAATLAELARVVRAGGTVAALEFAIPRGVWRPLWELYVRAVLPATARVISEGWARVGRFLGGSIRSFWAEWPEERLLAAWRDAGIDDVRARRLSLGGGIVIWGRRR
jgi:demethylmenaquinone methyltransferase/2-methoxy-6-polyprenyl-1,4-benzoquinol methylase